jgi:hypothetical protein
MIDSRHVSNLPLHAITVLAILGRVGCNFRHLVFLLFIYLLFIIYLFIFVLVPTC